MTQKCRQSHRGDHDVRRAKDLTQCDRRPPFQRVQGERDRAGPRTRHPQNIGGADIAAPRFPHIDSRRHSGDQEAERDRAGEVP